MASIRARSSAVRTRSHAASASSSCASVRGPMIGAVTPGCCATHAVASCDTGTPLSRARADRLSTNVVDPFDQSTLLRGVRAGVTRVFRGCLPTPVLARQQPARERAPGDHREPKGLGGRDQLPLDAPVQQVVGRLFRNEAVETELLGGPQRLDQLPACESGGTDVADLARPDEIVECAQRLVDRGVRFGPVDLVEVEMVGAEPLQARFGLAHDVAPGAAAQIGIGVVHRQVHLARQEHRVALAVPPERLARDFLAEPARIDVGGVEHVDAGVDRAIDDAP